ncbi:hypothetical protein AVEN_215716-1 [Araneus ventricosus]|uniref:Uncharacterized protein n=1 Tax=Araneus ventricosus TaxID=182803 RepID=A0A4Y2QLJ6_ARAVE|nr:hypothetical protein AVEN_215716-1 [Araneus ventricosus]
MGHYLQDTFPVLERENIFYWSDSQICIHWIKGKADDRKQIVRNRVSEIEEKTNPNRWHHCAGKGNPADQLTRGVSAQALVNDEIWFSGPAWLLQINLPCNKSSDIVDTELNYVEKKDERPNREKVTDNLTANELINAEKYWVRCVQQTEFETEYEEIKHHKSVTQSSKLFSLNPMMTEDGLSCLGGRLQKSDFNFYEKQPLILPARSRLSHLLIMREHQRLHHAGMAWEPDNGPLPANRIQARYPFENVGIDFAGPIYNRNTDEAYIALFTCAARSGVQLEHRTFSISLP